MTLDRPLVMTADALQRLERVEGIGELHTALSPTPVWHPADEEAAADAEARAALADQGGLDRHGRVDRDVAATLGLLCRAEVEYFGCLFYGGAPVGVLVAATGQDAVLAVKTGDEITLRQTTSNSLVAALVGQLPEWPAGRGQPIQFAPGELDGTAPRHHPAAELRAAKRIFELPVRGNGELLTAVRDRTGRKRVVVDPLRFADTSEGRWLNLAVAGPQPEVLLAPASPQSLVQRLQAMHDELVSH